MTIDWSEEALKREKDKEKKTNKETSSNSSDRAYSRKDSDYVPKHEYEKTRGM